MKHNGKENIFYCKGVYFEVAQISKQTVANIVKQLIMSEPKVILRRLNEKNEDKRSVNRKKILNRIYDSESDDNEKKEKKKKKKEGKIKFVNNVKKNNNNMNTENNDSSSTISNTIYYRNFKLKVTKTSNKEMDKIKLFQHLFGSTLDDIDVNDDSIVPVIKSRLKKSKKRKSDFNNESLILPKKPKMNLMNAIESIIVTHYCECNSLIIPKIKMQVCISEQCHYDLQTVNNVYVPDLRCDSQLVKLSEIKQEIQKLCEETTTISTIDLTMDDDLVQKEEKTIDLTIDGDDDCYREIMCKNEAIDEDIKFNLTEKLIKIESELLQPLVIEMEQQRLLLEEQQKTLQQQQEHEQEKQKELEKKKNELDKQKQIEEEIMKKRKLMEIELQQAEQEKQKKMKLDELEKKRELEEEEMMRKLKKKQVEEEMARIKQLAEETKRKKQLEEELDRQKRLDEEMTKKKRLQEEAAAAERMKQLEESKKRKLQEEEVEKRRIEEAVKKRKFEEMQKMENERIRIEKIEQETQRLIEIEKAKFKQIEMEKQRYQQQQQQRNNSKSMPDLKPITSNNIGKILITPKNGGGLILLQPKPNMQQQQQWQQQFELLSNEQFTRRILPNLKNYYEFLVCYSNFMDGLKSMSKSEVFKSDFEKLEKGFKNDKMKCFSIDFYNLIYNIEVESFDLILILNYLENWFKKQYNNNFGKFSICKMLDFHICLSEQYYMTPFLRKFANDVRQVQQALIAHSKSGDGDGGFTPDQYVQLGIQIRTYIQLKHFLEQAIAKLPEKVLMPTHSPVVPSSQQQQHVKKIQTKSNSKKIQFHSNILLTPQNNQQMPTNGKSNNAKKIVTMLPSNSNNNGITLKSLLETSQNVANKQNPLTSHGQCWMATEQQQKPPTKNSDIQNLVNFTANLPVLNIGKNKQMTVTNRQISPSNSTLPIANNPKVTITNNQCPNVTICNKQSVFNQYSMNSTLNCHFVPTSNNQQLSNNQQTTLNNRRRVITAAGTQQILPLNQLPISTLNNQQLLPLNSQSLTLNQQSTSNQPLSTLNNQHSTTTSNQRFLHVNNQSTINQQSTLNQPISTLNNQHSTTTSNQQFSPLNNQSTTMNQQSSTSNQLLSNTAGNQQLLSLINRLSTSNNLLSTSKQSSSTSSINEQLSTDNQSSTSFHQLLSVLINQPLTTNSAMHQHQLPSGNNQQLPSTVNNSNNNNNNNQIVDKPISEEYPIIDEIDLTWIEDVDPVELKDEIDSFPVKEESDAAYKNNDNNDNNNIVGGNDNNIVNENRNMENNDREVVSPADSGLGSPIVPNGKIFQCSCGEEAIFVCRCNASTYCSRECQYSDWSNHQRLCHRIFDEDN